MLDDIIKKQYKELLNDPNFEKLEIELQKPNIFSILGIGRMEIRHSNFLAWLLDPNGSHGLGNRFLIRVLRDLAIDKKNKLDIFKINELNFNNVEVNREVPISLKNKNKDGLIDILIIFRDESDKLVICIENKIDTTDSDGQLKNYREYIEDMYKNNGYEKMVFVYLTPYGTNSNNEYETEKWSNYSYAGVKESESSYGIIKHLENIQKSLMDLNIETYICDYLTTLKYEIMGNQDSDIEKMANSIYDKHRPIFEFVFKNKSNELYKLDWEKDYSWVIKSAEKFKQTLKEIDSEIDDKLGYTKTYISIKRNKQICYLFGSREKEPNCAMDFNFDKTGNEEIFDFINEQLMNIKKPKVSYFNDKYKLFTINNINEFIDKHSEILKEIHRKRFGLNQ